ncbi:hypothetical protein [Nocardioides sambongensis]|uniref:hypothetical protein n=1 Tax=Nocardioides sambongensis TaxID=2589074 RepID=UPI00112B9002|nr:hypothetical protein [Nocardioides sambongensis]
MTRGLLVVLTVIALVLVAQTAWFVLGDDEASARADSDAPISVPDDRPIQMNDSDAQSGAEAAATALVDIVARKSTSYDDDVAKASEVMTERFAAEYQETTDQIKDEFVANKTDVQARVVGQGVVRASASEMEVLVFLNQYVTKGTKADRKTTYAPYRAVVTVVNTDRGGWSTAWRPSDGTLRRWGYPAQIEHVTVSLWTVLSQSEPTPATCPAT